MTELADMLSTHLKDPEAGWSMGTFGAIAEFHQDAGEALVVDAPAVLCRATERGGVWIDPARLTEIVPVAYEALSPRAHRWSHAVALCLPEGDARRKARAHLTDLGPDEAAIRSGDRGAILFDMGLSLPQCDFCIRTEDVELLEVLRRCVGRSLFEPDNPAMPAILKAHPHRVAVTAIGRVEVFQKIGGPDTGGVSPSGPHTHVLPQVLRSGRTHSANTPIPAGLMPLGSLHPGNPVVGPMGEERAFDAHLHERFQALLQRFGNASTVAIKTDLLAALACDARLQDFAGPNDRFARATVRVALRQQEHLARLSGDDKHLAKVLAWRAVHDRAVDAADTDDEAPGH
ncbi:hypothetical protein HT585_15355 [Ensifer sp. HO-A22]|uniref:Uncharacterized protein n=1 Tax=Ensifer oleiphilus TaxID=2742698 RepID=A0A7Y6UNP9_9HYPH|nr:hypothetical protein [Ensifer oleiphilus]NVD40244.1 hypothetical protein [Ensifer oleiphilus]